MKLIYPLFNCFLKLSTKMKIATILIVIAVSLFLYKSVQYSLLKYSVLQEKAKQVEVYKDSLKVAKKHIKTLLKFGKELNESSKLQTKKIDEKLKKDEEYIYIRNITVDELFDFLSKYEERQLKSK